MGNELEMEKVIAAKTIFVLAPNDNKGSAIMEEYLQSLVAYIKYLANGKKIYTFSVHNNWFKNQWSYDIGHALLIHNSGAYCHELDEAKDGKEYFEMFRVIKERLLHKDERILIVIVYEKFFVRLTNFYATAILDYHATTYIQPPMSLWIIDNLNKVQPSIISMSAKSYKEFVAENNLLPPPKIKP